MNKFKKVVQENMSKLEEYVPVVKRVHGETHPEFHKLSRVFNKLNKKIKEEREDLDGEFKELREITNNYTVPNDTCETYEAVYKMIQEIDEAYRS